MLMLQLPTPLRTRRQGPHRRRRPPATVATMASSSGSRNPVVLGCGGISADYLATVASFPNPDDKIRSLTLKVQGGGNTGNALTAAARLGLLAPRIISKVADDAQGRSILKELEADGVDTSYMVVAEHGNSPFTYVIVDNQTKTRTCIHTPGYPQLVPEELTKENLFAALDGVDIIYFDVRLHDTALVVAEEVWTGASSVPVALVSMLSRLPNVKFVIVTLGERGCIMLERSMTDASEAHEIDVEALLESLEQKVDRKSTMPKCIASKSNLRISADGVDSISGRLLVGTAEVIPPEELIDTTGAGDAFIGSVLYGLCTGLPPEKMLPFCSTSGWLLLQRFGGSEWPSASHRRAPGWLLISSPRSCPIHVGCLKPNVPVQTTNVPLQTNTGIVTIMNE